jgi:hypothetical protein
MSFSQAITERSTREIAPTRLQPCCRGRGLALPRQHARSRARRYALPPTLHRDRLQRCSHPRPSQPRLPWRGAQDQHSSERQMNHARYTIATEAIKSAQMPPLTTLRATIAASMTLWISYVHYRRRPVLINLIRFNPRQARGYRRSPQLIRSYAILCEGWMNSCRMPPAVLHTCKTNAGTSKLLGVPHHLQDCAAAVSFILRLRIERVEARRPIWQTCPPFAGRQATEARRPGRHRS